MTERDEGEWKCSYFVDMYVCQDIMLMWYV